MKKIIFQDTTLRDGEQTPGVAYSYIDKKRITGKLIDLSVDYIELGFPAASKEESEMIRKVANYYKKANTKFCVFARALINDIDIAYESINHIKARRIQIVVPASDLHIRYSTSANKKSILENLEMTLKYAKSKFSDIQLTAQDAPRANFKFLKQIINIGINSGVTTICLPDTAGHCLSNEYASLIKKVKKIVGNKVLISAHCHNDLGVATSNTIAAIESGADQVEGTINGIGERAGNTPIEEVAAILDLKYKNKFKTKLKFRYFKSISALLESIVNYKIHFNKPIFGRNAFLHASGMHQKAIIKNKNTFEVIDASKFGYKGGKIALGKLSGKAGIKNFLDMHKIKFDSEDIDKISLLIKKESINSKEFNSAEIKKYLNEIKK